MDFPVDLASLGGRFADRLAEVAIVPAAAPRAPQPGRLPTAGPVQLGPVVLGSGRSVSARDSRAGGQAAVFWLSDAPVTDPAPLWWALAQQFPTTGLWPLMLQFLEGESGRPWDVGEFYPATEADVDALDPRHVLETGWHDGVVPINNPWPPGTGPLAPFGPTFPGLAAPGPETDAVPLALPAGGRARIGLVSCRRPADTPALIGWTGALNVRRATEVSAVLRSWEDRFGAIPVGLGFATMTLLVTRPPTNAADALHLAAEVAAFCPDALWQPREQWPYEPRDATLDQLSRSLVRGHMWRLWFD